MYVAAKAGFNVGIFFKKVFYFSGIGMQQCPGEFPVAIWLHIFKKHGRAKRNDGDMGNDADEFFFIGFQFFFQPAKLFIIQQGNIATLVFLHTV